MSNTYGLVVFNNNSGLMFDSRQPMASYVVKDIGTGSVTSVGVRADDFVFVKRPSDSTNTKIYISNRKDMVNGTGGLIPQGYDAAPRYFSAWDTSTESWESAVLDYFIITHSRYVTSSEDYGLLIKNANNVNPIQFDSRAVLLGQHFHITNFFPPNTLSGDGTEDLGDVNDYYSVNWTFTNFDPDFPLLTANDFQVAGISWIGNRPTTTNIVDIGGGFGGDEPQGDPSGGVGDPTTGGGNSISNPGISGMILSAELV